MKPNDSLSRRMFLRGTGGALLALPTLTSLLPRAARAQSTAPPRYFIGITTGHGGLWGQHLYPADATLTDTRSYRGHAIRRGDLALTVEGGVASLSPVLRADAGDLTAGLARKMNAVRGFDLTINPGHGAGYALGNFGDNLGNNDQADRMKRNPTPTIDQLMAWSDAMYPNLDGVLRRSLQMGTHTPSSGFANPAQRSGPIEKIRAERNPRTAFESIYVPPQSEDPARRQPPTDHVLEMFRVLRASTRLSNEDRRRLENHMERVDELHRRLAVVVSCGDMQAPPSSGSRSVDLDIPDARTLARLYADVAVAALVCGTTRIITIGTFAHFSEAPHLNWHHEVAHQVARNPQMQDVMVAAKRHLFQSLFVPLAKQLDDIQTPHGGTLLDDSLIVWHQEAGVSVHGGLQFPSITAGSAGGALLTGQYLDYRDLDSHHRSNNAQNLEDRYRGLLWNQYLSNLCLAMGVSASEYRQPDTGGYGYFYWPHADRYPGAEAIGTNLDERLPWLWSDA